MSKRYGRNQKRKALERIADLEDKNRRLTSSVEQELSTIEAAKNIIDVARRISPNSILFPPQRRDVSLSGGYITRYAVYNEKYSGDVPVKHDIRTVDLMQLSIDLEDTEGMIHFTGRLEDGVGGTSKACYYITRNGFRYQNVDNIVDTLVSSLKYDMFKGV